MADLRRRTALDRQIVKIRIAASEAQSFRRVDIGPLTVTRLSGTDGRWNIVSSGCAL